MLAMVSYPETVAALTLLHSERPKLYGVWAVLSAKGLNKHALTIYRQHSITVNFNTDSYEGVYLPVPCVAGHQMGKAPEYEPYQAQQATRQPICQ